MPIRTSSAARDQDSGVEPELPTRFDGLRRQADAVVDHMRPQIDAVSDYARDEPTKALLIAAATGAGLMALIALMARSSRPALPVPKASTLAAIRDAALDLADRAHTVASDTMDRWATTQKRAGEAYDSASTSVGTAADAASEAWKSLREQTAPVVDKLRPQIDAVTAYARDEPTRAALGVAAAGAVLVGLMTMLRRD